MSDLEVRVKDLEKNMLKFLVNVFKRLYFLNLRMKLVHTDDRYWSDSVRCTIPTHLESNAE